MRQVIQSARTGRLSVREVPEPKVRAGHLLVRTRTSLISAGTERMVVGFARKSLAGKAAARPDLVRKVIDKAMRDGVLAAFRAVVARLDEPLPLGYSAAGEIVAVGSGLEGRFAVGQRVAIAGAGAANHAEINAVPANLVAAMPEGVPDEHAAFATVCAIALHAVRNARITLGDTVAVVGVGLIGQLAAQFARLSGARVVALDYDHARLDLARGLGAEAALDLAGGDVDDRIARLTGGLGCDSVLIAAATESNEPFQTAARIARDRARIVMVGMTGTQFPYAEFMKKELSVVVSRSYGPGRYDAEYEQQGLKYPEGWVRWTETANMEESLRRMIPGGGLSIAELITHRFPLADAGRAYDLVTGGDEPSLGVVLTYPDSAHPDARAPKPVFAPPAAKPAPGACAIGLIGAGAFARSVIVPELQKISGVTLETAVARRGASAEQARETFGFKTAATDESAILDNPAINAVIVATRHDSHAGLAARALARGKAVLVEKPLALSFEQLNEIAAARAAAPAGAFFQVGFNRRFAPLALALKQKLAAKPGPKFVLIRVNAGALERESWAAGAAEGGGRIVGEACHFLDLARFLVGRAITSVFAEAGPPGRAGGLTEDASIQLRFADGSLAAIAYAAQGDAKSGKERIEAFAGGASFVLDDFRTLTATEQGRTETTGGGAPDKGVAAELAAFVRAVREGGGAPVDEAELIETSTAILAAMDSLQTGQRVVL